MPDEHAGRTERQNCAYNRGHAWVPFVLGRAFAKRIGRGKIVNLHDSRLKGYDWTHVGYILSKHVLAAMTRMMALEFAPDITVNAVAFLVQSDFVTGNVIYVDGGRHLHEYSDGSNPH